MRGARRESSPSSTSSSSTRRTLRRRAHTAREREGLQGVSLVEKTANGPADAPLTIEGPRVRLGGGPCPEARRRRRIVVLRSEI